MKKATGKLFLALTNIIVLCSFLFVGVLATIEPAVSFSVNVKYDQAIKVMAYISTNAENAIYDPEGTPQRFYQEDDIDKLEGSDVEGNVNQFVIDNRSALFLDTIATTPQNYPDLEKFEDLNDGGHLNFDVTGIKFYIYVENHNLSKRLDCKISVEIEKNSSSGVLDFEPFGEPINKELGAATDVDTPTKMLIIVEIEPDLTSPSGNLESEITINVEFSSGMEVEG